MGRPAESEMQPGSRARHGIGIARVLSLSLLFVLLGTEMLVAQNASAGANQTQADLRSAQDQTPRPGSISTIEAASPGLHPRYNFPENECSADFWNPYETEAIAITESPARVQDSSLEEIGPADTVQELPDEVVDPAEGTQQVDSEVIQPMARVGQLHDEVVQADQPLGDLYPTMPSADAPGDHPDNP